MWLVRSAALPSTVSTTRADPKPGQQVQGWWYVDNSTNPPMYTLCTPKSPVVMYPAEARSRPQSQQGLNARFICVL